MTFQRPGDVLAAQLSAVENVECTDSRRQRGADQPGTRLRWPGGRHRLAQVLAQGLTTWKKEALLSGLAVQALFQVLFKRDPAAGQAGQSLFVVLLRTGTYK